MKMILNFSIFMKSRAMSNQAMFTETLLEACRTLGPVRVVLRNGVGMAELFTVTN